MYDAVGPDPDPQALETERLVRELRELASSGGRRTPARRARSAVRAAMTDQTDERIEHLDAGQPAVTDRAARLARVVRTIGARSTARALGVDRTLIETKLVTDRLPVLPPVERRLATLEAILADLHAAGLRDGDALRSWLRAPRSKRGKAALDLIAAGTSIDHARRLVTDDPSLNTPDPQEPPR